MAPNKVAQYLGRRRMESMSEEELREFQSAAAKAGSALLTDEQRRERARAAAVERWRKVREQAAADTATESLKKKRVKKRKPLKHAAG